MWKTSVMCCSFLSVKCSPTSWASLNSLHRCQMWEKESLQHEPRCARQNFHAFYQFSLMHTYVTETQGPKMTPGNTKKCFQMFLTLNAGADMTLRTAGPPEIRLTMSSVALSCSVNIVEILFYSLKILISASMMSTPTWAAGRVFPRQR